MELFEFKDGILYFTTKDQHSLDSLISAFRKAFADRKFIPNKTPLYLDISQSETELNANDIRRLVKYIAKHGVSRVAVIVSDVVHFGIARLCYRFYYTEGIKAKVFTETIKAKAFCSGIEDEPIQFLRHAN
jgi:hypothetical protein